MRLSEARFPSQADEDHREAFDRHAFGFPYVNWLYWHRLSKVRQLKADLNAPYADPITGGMRQMEVVRPRPPLKRVTKVVSKEVYELTQKLKRPPHPWTDFFHNVWRSGQRQSEPDPVTVEPIRVEPEPRPRIHYAPGYPIEYREIPKNLMVNRQIYLGHINAIMVQWGIETEEQFEAYREDLIRHGLHRMGLL